MAQAIKPTDWEAVFSKMQNTRYKPETLYKLFLDARAKAIAERTVDALGDGFAITLLFSSRCLRAWGFVRALGFFYIDRPGCDNTRALR